jgi:lipid-binding SYLF domain-containing protein
MKSTAFMRRAAKLAGLVTISALGACEVAPKQADAESFDRKSTELIATLSGENPQLATMFDDAYACAVFPSVGQGGFIISSGWGHGAVYQGGIRIGYALIAQHSIGALIGGDKWSLVVFFNSEAALDQFKEGKLAGNATANYAFGKAGDNTGTNYAQDVVVKRVDPTGAMLNASIGFSNFKYESNQDAAAIWKKAAES